MDTSLNANDTSSEHYTEPRTVLFISFIGDILDYSMNYMLSIEGSVATHACMLVCCIWMPLLAFYLLVFLGLLGTNLCFLFEFDVVMMNVHMIYREINK